jgi:hypothetical protein
MHANAVLLLRNWHACSCMPAGQIQKQTSLTSCADSSFFQVLSGVDLSSCCPAFCSAIQTVEWEILLTGAKLGAAWCRDSFCSAGGPELAGRLAKHARREPCWRALSDLHRLVERVVKAKAMLKFGPYTKSKTLCECDRIQLQTTLTRRCPDLKIEQQVSQFFAWHQSSS